MEVHGVNSASIASPTRKHVVDSQLSAQRGYALTSSIHSGDKESWGSCAYRWVTFIPNLIWTAVKRVIYVLTCCQYCADEPTKEQVVDALKVLIKVWTKDSPASEKEQAWKDFMKLGKDAKELLADTYVDAKAADSVLKQDEAAKWKTKYGAETREQAMRRLDQHDPSLLRSVLGHLDNAALKEAGTPSDGSKQTPGGDDE